MKGRQLCTQATHGLLSTAGFNGRATLRVMDIRTDTIGLAFLPQYTQFANMTRNTAAQAM